MPARAMRWGAAPAISAPRRRTEPRRGGAMPAIALKVVDLPAPLRPSRATVCPSPTASPSPNRIWLAP